MNSEINLEKMWLNNFSNLGELKMDVSDNRMDSPTFRGEKIKQKIWYEFIGI